MPGSIRNACLLVLLSAFLATADAAATSCFTSDRRPVAPPPACLGDGELAERFRVALMEQQEGCNAVPYCETALGNFTAWYGPRAAAFYVEVIERCFAIGNRDEPLNLLILWKAVEGLNASKEPASIPALVHVLKDADLWPFSALPVARMLRMEALNAIAARRSEKEFGVLLGRILFSPDAVAARPIALERLRTTPVEVARTYLSRYLKVAKGELRQVTLDALHRLDHPDDGYFAGESDDATGHVCLYTKGSDSTLVNLAHCPRYHAYPEVPVSEGFGPGWTYSREWCPGPLREPSRSFRGPFTMRWSDATF